MSSSVHIANKNKDIFTFGEVPTQELGYTKLTAEAEYSNNFSRSQKQFYLSFHDDERNSFLFVNATKIYQFKAKISKITPYPLFSGNT